MTHADDAKQNFKESWDDTKGAASNATEGVKDTANHIGDEIKEAVDGEDR